MIEALEIPHFTSKTTSHVTVSVGIAIGNAKTAPHFLKFFEAADKMLYAAKEGGRNRVKCVQL
jgi:diguanylate cyclase (GGDEF)-like protein